MKVSVYIRDVEELEGLFVGHAEHSELDDVVAMFQRGQGYENNVTWDVYLSNASFDPDNYQFEGVQFASDSKNKNLIVEIMLSQERNDG